MIRIVLVLVMPLLMAASCDPVKPAQPINAHCDDMCFAGCADLTAWNGTREQDKLTALMDAHDAEHAECDQHRAACVACINSARKSGAIK